jgi:hypothetical protein
MKEGDILKVSEPEKCIEKKGRQADMHQTLLNAEFASVEYRNSGDKNVHIIRMMAALTKEMHKCFCCTYACRQSHFTD